MDLLFWFISLCLAVYQTIIWIEQTFSEYWLALVVGFLVIGLLYYLSRPDKPDDAVAQSSPGVGCSWGADRFFYDPLREAGEGATACNTERVGILPSWYKAVDDAECWLEQLERERVEGEE